VFEQATIESIYDQGDERYFRRFDFRKSKDGVENESIELCETDEVKTTVKLLNIRADYQKHFPKSSAVVSDRPFSESCHM